MKKSKLFAAAGIAVCAALVFAACGPKGEEAHTHDWGEWKEVSAPTCEQGGTEKRTCRSDPSHTETRPVGALGHKWSAEWSKDEKGHYHVCENGCGKHEGEAAHAYKEGACTVCGYIHLSHQYEAGVCGVCGKRLYTESGEGSLIYFGEYPQSEVKEEAVTSVLAEKAGDLPTEENAGNWTSYGYYYGGEVTDYMWYIDVELDESRYRGVYFTEERNCKTSSTFLSYQGDNGYLTETVYWFRFEPIEWRVLENKDGTALLMANIILDGGQYYHDIGEIRTQDGGTVYPNNYKESDIRKWLIENFYETAFDGAAKQIIETSTVDNRTGVQDYASEDTQDKVFLLSAVEAENESYGFVTSASANASRQLKATDYAKAQGIQPTKDSEYFSWWLRTPEKQAGGKTAFKVSETGMVRGGVWWMGGGEYVNYVCNGIVPAIRLHL